MFTHENDEKYSEGHFLDLHYRAFLEIGPNSFTRVLFQETIQGGSCLGLKTCTSALEMSWIFIHKMNYGPYFEKWPWCPLWVFLWDLFAGLYWETPCIVPSVHNLSRNPPFRKKKTLPMVFLCVCVCVCVFVCARVCVCLCFFVFFVFVVSPCFVVFVFAGLRDSSQKIRSSKRFRTHWSRVFLVASRPLSWLRCKNKEQQKRKSTTKIRIRQGAQGGWTQKHHIILLEIWERVCFV